MHKHPNMKVPPKLRLACKEKDLGKAWEVINSIENSKPSFNSECLTVGQLTNLLEERFSISNKKSSSKESPLVIKDLRRMAFIKACKYGFLEMIIEIMDKGYEDGDYSEIGDDILATAVSYQRSNVIHHLISSGVNPSNESAISFAIMKGDTETIRLLFEKGYDIERIDHASVKALITHFDEGVLRFFIEKGLDLDKFGRYMSIAAAEISRLDILKILVEYGVNLIQIEWACGIDTSKINKYCSKPVAFHAIVNSDMDILKYLFELGLPIAFDVNMVLQLAVRAGNLDIMRFLHEMGEDLNWNRSFCLRTASRDLNLPLVKLLIELGASYDKCGGEMMGFFVEGFGLEASWRLEAIKFLMKLGINLGPHLNKGLKKAACLRHSAIDLVKFYHENGASIHNPKVLSLAVKNNRLEVVKYLIENGLRSCEVNVVLPLVLNKHSWDILRYLLEQFPDLDLESILSHFKPGSDYLMPSIQMFEYLIGRCNFPFETQESFLSLAIEEDSRAYVRILLDHNPDLKVGSRESSLWVEM